MWRSMTHSQLIVQRDNQFVITAGQGRDDLVRIVRHCAVLTAIVADSQVYERSAISLWGYAAHGGSASELLDSLSAASSDALPATLIAWIVQTMARYGVLRLSEADGFQWLSAAIDEPFRLLGLEAEASHGQFRFRIDSAESGRIKVEAARFGWFVVDDRCGVSTPGNDAFRFRGALRPYQQAAVDAFMRGRHGLVQLPCGGGKTVVGVAAAAMVGGPVLVVVPSRTIANQWHDTFISTAGVERDDIAVNRIGRRVSIVTYHTAAGRTAGNLLAQDWRMVIYDEVQSLPADTFRLAAQIQADYRLGLTATLVREDGREREIAALVGPPLFDISWRELERQGWIAPAHCVEVRVPLAVNEREALRYRISIVERLLARHESEPTLVVGTRLAGLVATGERLGFPVVTGRDGVDMRAQMLDRFRAGDIRVLGLSRIGSVGIDLPDAAVLIQVSGTFGSRQEEAQRLGRLLRPSPEKSAYFYTIVETGTREVADAARRQRFLVNQGYDYEVVDAGTIERPRRT